VSLAWTTVITIKLHREKQSAAATAVNVVPVYEGSRHTWAIRSTLCTILLLKASVALAVGYDCFKGSHAQARRVYVAAFVVLVCGM
jgi:hypothetical protein